MAKSENPNPESLIKSQRSPYDEFIRFRLAMVRAIARTWNDLDFKERLLRHPIETLRRDLDYDCPFSINLTIMDSKNPAKTHHYHAIATGGWVGSNNWLTYYIPPAPENPADRPEALAALGQLTFMYLALKSDLPA